MENASKALLIAGSILVVILLIAMGVRVFNSTQSTTDSVEGTLTSTDIATFNSKFTAYAGNGKSAAQVKALANIVIANNATNTAHQVSFAGSYDSATITSTAASYTGACNITLGFDTNGYVNSITISQ